MMLLDIEVQCPECRRATTIAVSVRDDGQQSGTGTQCKACDAQLITLTLEDRSVVVQGASGQTLVPGSAVVGALGGEPVDNAPIMVIEPPNFGLLDRPFHPPDRPRGLSDEELEKAMVVSGMDGLFRPDGSIRSTKEMAKSLGYRGAWVAELSWALTERIHGPAPLTSPPEIFISYRWRGEGGDPWVDQLARHLQKRGYPVVYDLDLGPSDDPDVPGLVSRIADCRYFLAVLDSGYAERIGANEHGRVLDGWVFDEVNTARSLSNAGMVRIVGLLREGDQLADGFGWPEPGRMGNVVDVRSEALLAQFLDSVFPPLDIAVSSTKIRAAREAIRRSYQHALGGEIIASFAAAAEVRSLVADSPDGELQTIRVALHCGYPREGLAATERALRQLPGSQELLLAGVQLAMSAGMPRRQAGYARRVLDLGPDEEYRNSAQFGLGNALDDLERVDAAISHLRCVVARAPDTPSYLTSLAYMLRRLGAFQEASETLARAIETAPRNPAILENCVAVSCELGDCEAAEGWLARFAEVDPRAAQGARPVVERCRAHGAELLVRLAKLPAAHRTIGCDHCQAEVRATEDDDVLCAHCGVPRSEGFECDFCGSDGSLVPGLASILARCPFCARGALEVRHTANSE